MKNSITFLLLIISSFAYCQERYVKIEDQKFRIKEFGQGPVTVIFENGMSDSLEVWGSIPDSVAKFARVFTYDRAFIGKSDTSRLERTIPNMMNELKNILEHEKINPPYVLIAHSMGGYITRYFADRHPHDVKGMLLLDPVSESFWDSMNEKELKEYIEGGTEWYRTRFPKNYWKEWDMFISNREYMRDLNIPKDLPLILVSATDWNWYKYQKKLISGFTNARHILLEGQHHIFKDHPVLIIGYIRDLACQK